MKVLSVLNLTLRFGGLTAISNVSFELFKGEILAIIGPNGAGKTSLFNVITGLYHATSGRVEFLGKELINEITIRQLLASIFLSLIFSLAVVCMINAQELWQAVIVSNYTYQEPFSLSLAVSSFISFFKKLDNSWSIYPFLIAMFFTVAAIVKFQNSAKYSPLVASKHGIARTFQNLRLMGSSTVADNIKTVIMHNNKPGLIACMLRLPSAIKFEKLLDQEVLSVLNTLELDNFSNERADSLPYGLQRRLEIARALATNPKVLLLDEPAAGLNPTETNQLLSLVKKIAESGITVLLIEHDMSLVMALSDRIVVLHHGEKIAEGTPDQITKNPEVIKAYLGSGAQQ